MDSDRQSTALCADCGKPALRDTHVRSAFWHEDQLVVVEDIPALVCGACHGQFYDDGTVMLLDLIRGDGFPPDKARAELRVPVFSFRDKIPPGRGS